MNNKVTTYSLTDSTHKAFLTYSVLVHRSSRRSAFYCRQRSLLVIRSRCGLLKSRCCPSSVLNFLYLDSRIEWQKPARTSSWHCGAPTRMKNTSNLIRQLVSLTVSENKYSSTEFRGTLRSRLRMTRPLNTLNLIRGLRKINLPPP